MYNGIVKVSYAKKQFLAYLKNSQGRSDKTIENYNRYLSRIFLCAGIKTTEEITISRVQKFRRHVSAHPAQESRHSGAMAIKTRNYHLSALRAFLRFLQLRGYTVLAPEQVRLTPVLNQSPLFLAESDLRRLLATPSRHTSEGKRDRAIIALLVFTGLRVSEVCALTRSDLNETVDELLVRGKGDSVRVVHLPLVVQNILSVYLASRHDDKTALFIRYGRKAHIGTKAQVSPRTIERLIQRYAVAAGLAQRVTPHIIRHSFAVKLFQSGMTLATAQSLLGYAHMSSVALYERQANGYQSRPSRPTC